MEKIYILIQLLFGISFLIVAIKKFILTYRLNLKNLDNANIKDILSKDTSILVLISISTLTLVIMSIIIYGNVRHISMYNIFINSIGIWAIFEIINCNKKSVLLIFLQAIILIILNIVLYIY